MSRKKRYIALGDSFTFCEGLNRKHEWAPRLAKECNFELVKVIAMSGWTTADLFQKCERFLSAYKFDIATLFIGVNDWFDGVTIDEFRNNLKKLIHLLNETNAEIILITIPNYLISQKGIEKTISILDETETKRFIDGKTIHDFNEIIKAAGNKFNLQVVDLENVLEAKDYGSDALHANEKGINKWLYEIKKILRQNGK